MPKNVNVNIFISAAKQFFVNRCEKAAVVIQRQLQVLSEVADENIFDPSANGAGPEFYVSLHELLSTVEANSNLAYVASDVLVNAIRNKTARPELINTYRFSWPIARLFLALPPSVIKSKSCEGDSRTFKLLCLLRELTYGIRLLWQESYLARLIRALLDIVTGTVVRDPDTSPEDAKCESLENTDDCLAVSLAILVNLCHRNLPALYCLLRAVDGREFIRTLFRLNKGTISLDANVQVSKMLVILEGVSGGIPDGSMQTFVHLTFTSMKEALLRGNTYLLRHVVDFFADVRGDGTTKPREALLNYCGYKEGVQSLLMAASDNCSPEEACYLLDFLCSLVELGVEGIKTMHPSLAALAVHWIKCYGEASHHALNLLCTLISLLDDESDDDDVEELENKNVDSEENLQEDEVGGNSEDTAKRKRVSSVDGQMDKLHSRRSILQIKPRNSVKLREDGSKEISSASLSVKTLVTQALPELLVMLEASIKEVTSQLPAKGETRSRLKSLFQLLSQLAKTSTLRQQMEDGIDKDVFTSLFEPILGTDSFMTEDLFQLDVVGLYTEALRFGTILAFKSASWLTLCSRLLSHSQLLSLLAMALLAGDWTLRQRVLSLVSTIAFPEDSVAALAKSMNSMEPLLMISGKERVNRSNNMSLIGIDGAQDAISSQYLKSLRGDNCPSLGFPQRFTEVFPLISQDQESRLDSFISLLQLAKDRNKIEDIAMSAVIELYEYKLAGMGHAERALQASLESATTHSSLLQHKLAQSSVEVSRLHQLLYYKQQCLEGYQSEKQQLAQKLQNEELKAMEKHSQHMQEMRGKNREIETLTRKEESLKRDLEVIRKEKEEGEVKYDKLMENFEGSNEKIKKLEEVIKKKEKLQVDTQKDVEKLNKTIKELQEDNNSLRLVSKRNEQIILEREAKIKETTRELQELQRIREVIYEISAGKKKMEK